jgi:UDP-N-acetylmuramyl pentapeptide phosphotransferase/UDP-N-acetylglucosamine-1-phosphate transferase
MNLNILLPVLLFFITLLLILVVINNSFFKKKLLVRDEFVLKNANLKQEDVITGIGVVFLVPFLISNIIFLYGNVEFPNKYIFFIISLTILTLLSFKDDIRSIDAKLRLIVHLICIYITIATLQINLIPLPLKVSILLTVLIWVYLMNITNFIDGSDGICAISVIFFYIGILFLSFKGYPLFSYYLALIILPILTAFLIFNLPNAKIFMGDSGSIFLGFLIGFSFLEVAILINPIYPVILFLYPILDCSITIIKKTFRGYMPWDRLGDYYFLLPKKRVKYENRKKISLFILKYLFIFKSLNLFFFYIFLEINNYYMLIINFFLGFLLISIFRLRRLNPKF